MSEATITTFSGRLIDVVDTNPDDIRIEDIAHHLAMKVRFSGALREFYSVAQHSVLVSLYLEQTGETLATQLAGLLHDANEAYLPDVPRPIKRVLGAAWKKYEEPLEQAIYAKFMATWERIDACWPAVKYADDLMIPLEARQFCGSPDWLEQPHWIAVDNTSRKLVDIFGSHDGEAWDVGYARDRFMQRFRNLAIERAERGFGE